MTATYPGGVDKDKPSLSNNYHRKDYNAHITLNKVGTYALKVTAWPVGVEDIDPSNNTGQTTIIIKADESYNAEKINSDNQTRVNLRS
ncbi:hypothetical protein [Syntrophomonas palmitatica]|uniref:hypothetical protein n=1 Tax=Syntrophomonas palmitatica TaxID=402877 RepID=UPI0006D1BBCB|nr:hypothetical protein [Syntrophomonas palmitatica]